MFIFLNPHRSIFFYFFASICITSAIFIIYSKNTIYSIFFLILVFLNVIALLLLTNIDFLPMMIIIIYIGAVTVLFLFVVMMLDIKIKTNRNNWVFLPIIIFIGIIFASELFVVYSKTFTLYHSFLFNYPEYYLHMWHRLSLGIPSMYIEEICYYSSVSELSIERLPYDPNKILGFSNKDGKFCYSCLRLAFDVIEVLDREQKNLPIPMYPDFINYVNEIKDVDAIGQVLYHQDVIYVILAGFILLVALIGAVVLTSKERHTNKYLAKNVFEQLSRKASNAFFKIK